MFYRIIFFFLFLYSNLYSSVISIDYNGTVDDLNLKFQSISNDYLSQFSSASDLINSSDVSESDALSALSAEKSINDTFDNLIDTYSSEYIKAVDLEYNECKKNIDYVITASLSSYNFSLNSINQTKSDCYSTGQLNDMGADWYSDCDNVYNSSLNSLGSKPEPDYSSCDSDRTDYINQFNANMQVVDSVNNDNKAQYNTDLSTYNSKFDGSKTDSDISSNPNTFSGNNTNPPALPAPDTPKYSCSDAYTYISSTCKAPNYVSGTCNDSINTLKCNVPQSSSNQQDDNVSNNIDVNVNMDATNELLSNLSSNTIDTNNKLSSIDDKLSISNDNLDIANNSLSSINSGISNLNDAINNSSIVSDISSIKDGLFSDLPSSSIDSSDIDEVSSFFGSVTSQYSEFYSNVSGQISTINQQFSDAKSLFSSSQSFNMNSGDASPDDAFTTVVFGQEIKLVICPYLKVFKPFIYFILTAYFMFQIFSLNLRYLLRSFE